MHEELRRTRRHEEDRRSRGRARALFGAYDENLKHLESLFGVRIRTQGNEVIVEGDARRRDACRAHRRRSWPR